MVVVVRSRMCSNRGMGSKILDMLAAILRTASVMGKLLTNRFYDIRPCCRAWGLAMVLAPGKTAQTEAEGDAKDQRPNWTEESKAKIRRHKMPKTKRTRVTAKLRKFMNI